MHVHAIYFLNGSRFIFAPAKYLMNAPYISLVF